MVTKPEKVLCLSLIFKIKNSNNFFVHLFLHFFEKIYFLFKGLNHFSKVIFNVFLLLQLYCGVQVCCCRDTCFFLGVMLLVVLVTVFLPFCLPMFFSNWCSWGYVFGDHSSRFQCVQGSDGDSLRQRWGHSFSCLVLLEVTWCSTQAFPAPGGCSIFVSYY